jgi:hypothetical protein
MKKLLVVPLILMLAACPAPRYVEVFNNTRDDLWIYTEAKGTFIKAGALKKLTENQFLQHESSGERMFPAVIWIQSKGQRTRQFSITRDQLPQIRPQQDVLSRVQIQPDGRIIFLDHGSPYSAYGSTAAPPGVSIQGHLRLPVE